MDNILCERFAGRSIGDASEERQVAVDVAGHEDARRMHVGCTSVIVSDG